MNFLTTIEIAQKLEEWADKKIPELVPGPKLGVIVSLNRLLSGKLDSVVKTLRLDGKAEWAKIVKEDYEKLQDAAKRATLDLTKRIVEFKLDRLDKRENGVSAFDILDPDFKMPTGEPWNDNEIPRTVYFDECAQCARQLARTFQQIATKAETIGDLSIRAPVFAKHQRIGTWLWKLYEKTLKVIVDAVLERVWPK